MNIRVQLSTAFLAEEPSSCSTEGDEKDPRNKNKRREVPQTQWDNQYNANYRFQSS